MHTAALFLVFLWITQDGVVTPAARLEALLPSLASSDHGKLDAAWAELENLCFQAGRPGAEVERKATALAIGAKLGEDVPLSTRVVLLRALEIVGKGEVTPVLAKLLAPGNDLALREGARRALEANPHVNAKRELRAGVKDADGTLRVGILRALGTRRDFLATAELISFAEAGELATRLAAIEALADIGDISAVPIVEKALSELQGLDLATAQRAYLRLADSLVRNGERGQARRIYDKAAGISPACKAAALLGFARADLQSEVGRIVEALADADPVVRGAAQEAAATLSGDAITTALIEKASAGPDADILRILARRGGKAAHAAVLAAASTARDDAVKAAALRHLGAMTAAADTRPVLALLLTALDSPGEVGAVAEEVLARIAEPAAIAAELATASGARQLALIRLLGARRDAVGLKALENTAGGAPSAVRVAVIKALGQIGAAASAEFLLAAIRTDQKLEQDAVIEALRGLQGKSVVDRVVDAAEGSRGPLRAAHLRVLGFWKDPSIPPLLAAAAKDVDEEVRAAALEGLARSDDAGALTVLSSQAAVERAGSPAHRAAVSGMLRLADKLTGTNRQQAAGVYLSALNLATSDDDLRVALRGVAEHGDPENLERIVRHLQPGPLQRDAGRAAIRLAERLPADKQAGARGVYEQILAADPDNATATQCVRRLRRLGVNVDFARRQGFVTRWWIVAGFPNPQGALWDLALPPESGVDLDKEIEHEGKMYAWKSYHTANPRGLVDLEEAGYGNPAAGAYLHAEVTVKEAVEATFKLGSDDQVVCWLNGSKIHANRSSRGLDVDQDTVKVKLAAGVNRILLKVLNDGGGWGACLRISSPDGKPLELSQRGE